MDKGSVEGVHNRPETEASIKAWTESGITCAPMIGSRRTADGHVVSYVRQLGPFAWDVRMSCPDEGKMRAKGRGVFTCGHGAFDARELIGMDTLPGEGDMTWTVLNRDNLGKPPFERGSA